MEGMKRDRIGEADKHGIRRKIEEKQVMVREQRKVKSTKVIHYKLP